MDQDKQNDGKVAFSFPITTHIFVWVLTLYLVAKFVSFMANGAEIVEHIHYFPDQVEYSYDR